MKNYALILTLSLLGLSCQAQNKQKLILDKIPFDLTKGNISSDTIFIDINGDNLKDILLEFDYRNFDVDVPKGNSGHELAIYTNKGNDEYNLKAVNRAILWVIHTSIFGVDGKTFCVANEEGGQDPNNYYCYFQYDSEKDNWFLFKHQIKTFNTGKEIIVEEKIYKNDEQIPFEKVSFDKLFGKIHNEAPDPVPFKLIRVAKATIYSKPNKPTKMYLVEGDNIEILEEKKEWIKFFYINPKTNKEIEGWIRSSDVEYK